MIPSPNLAKTLQNVRKYPSSSCSLRSPKHLQVQEGGGLDFGLSGMPKGSSPQATAHVKIAQNHGENAKFRSLAALARVTLGPGGGVGPWTFWEVQGTLQEGGLDLGLSGKSKVPSKRGVLDLGLAKIPDPFSRGGVVQSDVSISFCSSQTFRD